MVKKKVIISRTGCGYRMFHDIYRVWELCGKYGK